ncbi:hypothetical protein GN330_04440 [Nitratireductor sp. CAU 1489]|uniref:VOC domain-containing protein n=2 Tax=Nitratireductor arenosus TaxID=2682096 RepID=A0A844QB80_9HYPH|nr:hypothetical protein [Nitratireductor arenosus]
MPADDFGRSLPRGIGLNLLVPEIDPMERFFREVIGANTIYADEDFAAVEIAGSVLMLHADHSYADHEMAGVVVDAEWRGVGMEIRIYGVDPDRIEGRARSAGSTILSGTLDKPHGLRECHIVGPSGYIFVPSRAISREDSTAETQI